MILSRINEIVERAKEYLKKYSISPLEAIIRAMRDVEKEIENEQKD